MAGQFGFSENLDALSAMLGIPHSDFTFLFATAPKYKTVSDAILSGNDASNVMVPIGGAMNMTLREGRQSTSVKFLGSSDSLPLPGTGSAQMGMIQSLLIFADEPANSGYQITTDSNSEEHKWHLLKRMYGYMLAKHSDLIKYFYADGNTNGLGLTPVAFNDSDQWRNFSKSTLYDFPIGIYAVTRSSGGNTLMASFLEGVRLQGEQNLTVTSVNNTPIYETITFTYVNNIPVNPTAVINNAGTDGSGQFISLVKEYLQAN